MNTTGLKTRWLESRSDGSALVAAIGVAVIGIALSIVIVSVAIIATQDSARDRVRTVEIHAAEAVLDEAILSLESSAPCNPPDQIVGSGNTAINVATEITYRDASGMVLNNCTSGQIVGTPASAVVRTTATPVEVSVGIPPQRTMAASVNIRPNEVETSGSAVFSAGAFSTGAGFQVGSVDPNQPARVWIDSGNWTCNTSVTINGDLVVANGRASFQNATCQVTGNVWARTGFTSCCTPSAPYSVGGDVEVYAGTFVLQNRNRFGGDISVGGTIQTGTHWTNTTVAGSVCSTNVGGACTNLTDNPPMGLPEIDYVPSDWDGFVVRTKAQFGALIISEWGLTQQWQKDAINNAPCAIPSYMSTADIDLLPATNTIYDLRTCTLSNSGGIATFTLYSDVVFFATSFNSSNGMKFKSGDGQPHMVALIVPEGGTANNGIAEKTCRGSYCPGVINFSSGGIQVLSPINIFLYTPQQLTFPNTSTTEGQMYAGAVTVGQGNGVFKFLPVDLPYGYLTIGESSSSGATVEVINKSEV